MNRVLQYSYRKIPEPLPQVIQRVPGIARAPVARVSVVHPPPADAVGPEAAGEDAAAAAAAVAVVTSTGKLQII